MLFESFISGKIFLRKIAYFRDLFLKRISNICDLTELIYKSNIDEIAKINIFTASPRRYKL